jgi:hypothetical protein
LKSLRSQISLLKEQPDWNRQDLITSEMRLSTCIAASFALLTVAVAPPTAHAQVQSRPRLLTPQERTFFTMFNQLMSDKPNRLV